jgi:hypothetical protein
MVEETVPATSRVERRVAETAVVMVQEMEPVKQRNQIIASIIKKKLADFGTVGKAISVTLLTTPSVECTLHQPPSVILQFPQASGNRVSAFFFQ